MILKFHHKCNMRCATCEVQHATCHSVQSRFQKCQARGALVVFTPFSCHVGKAVLKVPEFAGPTAHRRVGSPESNPRSFNPSGGPPGPETRHSLDTRSDLFDPWALQASIFLDFGPSFFQPRFLDGFFIDFGRIWAPFWHHFLAIFR